MRLIPPSLPIVFTRPAGFAALAAIASATTLAALLSRVTPALAESSTTAPVAAGSGSDCVISGKGIVEKGVLVYTAAEGGTPIAGFSTQEVALDLSEIPADPTTGRAKVRTGGGSGFRIDGFIDPLRVPLSARRDVPVVADHVWIGRGEVVKLRSASPGVLTVEATLTATRQKIKGKAQCTALAIGRIPADEPAHTSGDKSYVLRRSSLDLYAAQGGSELIFTIEVPAAETGVLLHGTESRGDFVHVTHQGSMVVDAWARIGDLKLFPKGELLDTVGAGSMVTMVPAKLKVDGAIKELKAPKNIELKLAASDTAKPIGLIESGADVIVIDTIAGWARVYPKGLEIVPPEGRDFWAKASDLGL